MNYKFIESKTELNNICDDLLKEKVIGVDLEADSMYCFKEKICLIQIAGAHQVFLIDPFNLKKISPFLRVLENNETIKVFHGADFDIRSLDRDYKAKVNNLFDTEIACRFLGVQERSLAALLKRNFNIAVKKKYQKADWSKRPFQQEMIQYSAMDVAYLTKLYEIISKKLINKNRLSWAKEEFEIEEKVRHKNNTLQPLFKKFKGAGTMDNRTLAVLENLLQFRIKIAKKKDLPLFKIMSDFSLTAMAEHKPVTTDQIIQIRVLSRPQIYMYANECIKAIIKAREIDDEKLPSYPGIKRAKRDFKVEKRVRQLKNMREKLSVSMGIEPGFLLNNALINSISLQKPENCSQLMDIKHIRHWQVANIGNDIIQAVTHG